ncbi:hypothetical protein H0H93_003620 [Arthromyces matolae]|nr:hypothetical protein H0H93_003620 [Arthromyces matolae]
MPLLSSHLLPSSPHSLHISQSQPDLWPWSSDQPQRQQGSSILQPSNVPRNWLNDFGLASNGSGRDRTPSYHTDSDSSILMSHIEKLKHDNKQLHKDLKSIKSKISLTQTEVSEIGKMIREMNVSLRDHDTVSNSDHLLLVPAHAKEDYPDIKFWTAKMYRAAKKNRNLTTSLVPAAIDTSGNIKTWYVETEKGEPVNAETVNAICTLAWTIWHELQLRGIAPTLWAKAGLVALNYYEHHMCQRFPQLSYCESNWKAHMIATNNYSS